MQVHDIRLLDGDHEFSIVEADGEIKYIVLNRSTHLTLEEFEEMVRRVEDFDPTQMEGTDE